jgi:putative DNA primase/helicase
VDLVNSNSRPIYSSHIKKEITNRVKELSTTRTDEFDKDLDVINMANGLYNWKTNEFRGHDPEHLSRIQIPVNYDPNAKCSNIMAFLNRVLEPKDVPKILEFIGYCLYREYPIQFAFILFGPGGTGKSTLLSMMRAFVGSENSAVVTPQELAKERFAGADLRGKLLNAPGDVGDNELEQTALIKCLIGTDSVRGQRKFKDSFAFQNYAKQIYGLNKIPPTKDKTSGWYRRVQIIYMSHILGDTEFTTEFLKSLTSDEEMSGLFNVAVGTLRVLMDNKMFTNQTSIEDIRDKYESASRPEETFCETYIEEFDGAVITKDVLYEYYKTFCKESGAEAMPSGKFTRFIHKNVSWCPSPRNTNDERGNVGGVTKPIWKNTRFDLKAWNIRKSEKR